MRRDPLGPPRGVVEALGLPAILVLVASAALFAWMAWTSADAIARSSMAVAAANAHVAARAGRPR